jgi:hypothetical protein
MTKAVQSLPDGAATSATRVLAVQSGDVLELVDFPDDAATATDLTDAISSHNVNGTAHADIRAAVSSNATATGANATNLANHLANATGAHAASSISTTAISGVTGTNVQAMLASLKTQIDAISSGGGTGDILGDVGSADNALVRSSGTGGKTVQGSSASLTDAGVLNVQTLDVVTNVSAGGYVQAATRVETDAVIESTAGAGVTIESVLVKDGLVDGRDVGTDGLTLDAHSTKLAGIENGAKDDQIAAQVPITDSGNWYSGSDVEAALQEVGAAADTLSAQVAAKPDDADVILSTDVGDAVEISQAAYNALGAGRPATRLYLITS